MKKLILLSLAIICSVLMLCNYTIAQDNNATTPDSTIIVINGDSFSIVLESNKTTGFSWQRGSNSDSNIVHLLSADYNAPSTNMTGKGGGRSLDFQNGISRDGNNHFTISKTLGKRHATSPDKKI